MIAWIAIVFLFSLIAIPALVLWSGGTFGQRCARAFPHDGVRVEQCIYDLQHGRRIER